MIAIEIAFLVFLAVVLVVAIPNIAKPLSQAYAERIKFRYKELGSDAETRLKERVSNLEQEVMDLKQQIKAIQETSDYALKQIESMSPESKIVLEMKEKQT